MEDVIYCLDLKIAEYESFKEEMKLCGRYDIARKWLLKKNKFILAKKILIEGCKEENN